MAVRLAVLDVFTEIDRLAIFLEIRLGHWHVLQELLELLVSSVTLLRSQLVIVHLSSRSDGHRCYVAGARGMLALNQTTSLGSSFDLLTHLEVEHWIDTCW